MARPPERSIPPSQPTPLRHLGIGGPGGGAERPVRVQLAVALIAGLVLVAVPLYLWRRPRPAVTPPSDAAAEAAPIDAAPSPAPSKALVAAALDGGVETADVTIGKVWIDSCQRVGPGPGGSPKCDRQPFFEEALAKSILENTACVPKLPKGGSISFALRIDHRRKRMSLFAGNSGSVRGRDAAGAIKCVARSLPTPDWESMPHEHARYVVAALAVYPPSRTAR